MGRVVSDSTTSPFDSRFATYEDRRVDYVTSEAYTPSSILQIAALEGRC
jgi:hypothetical protein